MNEEQILAEIEEIKKKTISQLRIQIMAGSFTVAVLGFVILIGFLIKMVKVNNF